jgi:DNA-binding LacI/PurR family transcriptional regulator
MAETSPSPITMASVARRAGVSQATVSLCLTNHPRISSTTRERVCALAAKMGYRPNPFVSTLMRVRRKKGVLNAEPVLAIVCIMDQPDAWRNSRFPTIRQMHEGAVKRAREHGYRAEEFWLHQNDMTPLRFSSMLHHRGIQGLLLGPSSEGAELPALQYEFFATVGLAPLFMHKLTTVCNDHYLSSLRAVRECHRLGYRRPGLVLLKEHRERLQARWEAGWQIAPKFHPDLQSINSLLLDDWSETMNAPFLRWLKKEKPDVILSPSGQVILGALAREGWRVPEDIGVVHLACPEMGEHISGIYQNGRLLGATAVDELVALVQAHVRGMPVQASTRMVDGIWNEGRTLRRLTNNCPKERGVAQ